MISKTGNKTHDDAVLAAESTRQAVVNVAGVSQATANTATITFYRACLASKITNGLDAGNELIALKNLGVTV
jgi:hypothetical protein